MIFFDTSVLIAASVADHIHHAASLSVYRHAAPSNACCGVHNLAEVYAVLTSIPGPQRISSEQASSAVENVREHLLTVSLDEKEHHAVIKQAAKLGVVGGTIYDLLIAHAAMKAKAKIIYTWNIRHFQRFGPEITRLIRTP